MNRHGKLGGVKQRWDIIDLEKSTGHRGEKLRALVLRETKTVKTAFYGL